MRRMEQTHNFKSLWLSLVVTTALIAGHVSAQDEFCGMPDEVSNLLAYSPIVKQGNFKDFLTTNNLARSKMIGSLGELSSNLLLVKPEMSTNDLSELITFFSDFYDYMINSSDEGIGQALSSQLPAAIEALYASNPVPFRKIRFNYSSLIQGAENKLPDYFMYGVYSFVNADRISLTVNVVNNKRNEQRSFAAIGQPQAVVKSVAAQIFDTFQRPSSPDFINPLPGRTWLALPSAQMGRELNASMGSAMCVTQGGRLPSREEIEIAYAFGEYFSTVKINPSSHYVVEEEGEVMLLNINQNQCVPEKNTSIDKGLVVCIKDN
jgi:hypothetical protein